MLLKCVLGKGVKAGNFNRGERVLSPLKAGETTRIRSPTGTWKPAECLRVVAPRSYEVLVDGALRRRNRKYIWRTAEPPNAQTSEEAEPFQRGLLLRHKVVILKLPLFALRHDPLKLILWVNLHRRLLYMRIRPSRFGDHRDKEDLLSV